MMPMDMHLWSVRSALCNELAARPEVFARVLARRPNDPLLRLALGLEQARRGDWGHAVAAFERAGWFGTANGYTFNHACLRLLVGDAESYRRLRRPDGRRGWPDQRSRPLFHARPHLGTFG